MDYVIELQLPIELVNQAVMAAKDLEQSDNAYLQEALHEKIDDWIRNEPGEKVSFAKQACVTVSAKLSDELLSQTERAAADFDMSVDDFVHQALQEKLHRLSEDAAHKEEMDRMVAHLLEKNGEIYRRLAQWPTAESVSQ